MEHFAPQHHHNDAAPDLELHLAVDACIPEPLDPFYDEVFGGLDDEHTTSAGSPWCGGAQQHHDVVDPASAPWDGSQQLPNAHFPAIDCSSHLEAAQHEQQDEQAGAQDADDAHQLTLSQQGDTPEQRQGTAMAGEAVATQDSEQQAAAEDGIGDGSRSSHSSAAATLADAASAAVAASPGSSGSTASSAVLGMQPCNDAAAAVACAQDTAVAPESDSSLPDIDDVPVEPPMQPQAASSNSAQQEAAADDEQQQQLEEEGAGERACVEEQQQAEALGGDADSDPPAASAELAATGCPGAAAAGADGDMPRAAAPLVASAPAPGAGSDGEQLLTVDADEFASPCTSWHSCATSASKVASSSTTSAISSRGFFVATAAAGAAAAATSAACSATPVASPVSSLHIALQEQQQQGHELGCAADPLSAAAGASSNSSLPAAAEEQQQDAAVDGVHGTGSAPIPVQQQEQQQQQEDDTWQSISPPLDSLSSSPPTLLSAPEAQGDAAEDKGHTAADDAATGPDAAPAAEGEDQQEEEAAAAAGAAALGEEYDDVGQGHFYADDSTSTAPSIMGRGSLVQQLLALAPHQQLAASASQMQLRQSELVDLSLSTSVHPGQQQQQQHFHPGWLTAHQQLPPAAAQAVERAAVALNDSYYYHGRPPPGLPPPPGPSASTAGAGSSSSGGGGLGGFGLVGRGIRRAGSSGARWSRLQTQPQQDQQARHRVPSPTQHAAGGAFGWPGATVLGDWFSSTMQQPLAAASRAAAGVGQRLGVAAAGLGGQHTGTPGAPGSQPPPSPLAAATAAAAGGEPSRLRGSSSSNSVDDAVLVEMTPDLPQSLQEQEDEAFRGLLFLGGRDSHARPVIIVNTDAIPAGHNPAPRDAALAYLLTRLGPIVTRGPYVLVIVALHSGPQFRLLPGVWCVRAHQALPRAFHKNVKHVILLQPSLLVKAAVTLLWPFVSSKAHAKVKQVQRLLDIDAATAGDVQVPHLGEEFLTTLQVIKSAS